MTSELPAFGIAEKRFVRTGDTLAQHHSRRPPRRTDSRGIGQLSRHAVRPRGVGIHFAVETDDVGDQVRQLQNRHLLSRADIDVMLLATKMLHLLELRQKRRRMPFARRDFRVLSKPPAAKRRRNPLRYE